MSWNRQRFNQALDRHITGNWGEDSVREEHPMCEACPEEKYSKCKFPCSELEEAEEKNYEARRKAEEEWAQYIEEQEAKEQ